MYVTVYLLQKTPFFGKLKLQKVQKSSPGKASQTTLTQFEVFYIKTRR